MARKYAVTGVAPNTASATLPLLTLISTASVVPLIHDIELSSDTAPANQNSKYALQYCTTAGTPGSSITPVALNRMTNYPAAQVTSGLATFSVGPTLTANAFALLMALNQLVPYSWRCKDGMEIELPPAASSGAALMALASSAAFNVDMTFHFTE